MTGVGTDIVVRHVRGLAALEESGRQGDAELLARYCRGGDGAAFEALVRRHGPLVWGVCRRVLGDHHDAEDAFQAAFLALARKAPAVAVTGSLGGWLYRVAYHAATRARARAASRRDHERQASVAPPADPLAEVTARELVAALDQELQALPEKYRAPLVLCCLEGRSRDEAARQLGWSLGTLKRRLEQGRVRLRGRLARRGLALPGTLLAASLCRAAVPPTLVAAAGRVALGTAPARVLALAEGALRVGGGGKLKALGAVLLAVGLATAGTAVFAGRSAAPAEQPPGAAVPPPGPAARDPITLAGRVLDSAGKPVGGARVAVLGWPRLHPREAGTTGPLPVLGQAAAGEDGQFRLALPGLTPSAFHYAMAIAAAPGQGMACEQFAPDARRLEVVLRVGREQVVRGRLVDLQGAPAANVVVRVESLFRKGEGGASEPEGKLPAWPAPVTTGPDGRFVVGGIGTGHDVTLAVDDDRFACRRVAVAADRPDPGGEVVVTLDPPHVLAGRVRYADTGKPVAGARLVVMVNGGNFAGRTDAEGRYRVPVGATTFAQVYVAPPNDGPYLVARRRVDWPRSRVRHGLDVDLPRGMEVRGNVADSSGRAVSGATVLYFPQSEDNPDYRDDVASLWHSAVTSGPDGTFAIAVPPGPAHLLVTGPTPDYVHRETTFSVLAEGRPNFARLLGGPEGNAYWGGQRMYAHAVVPIRPRRGTALAPVAVTLRPGVTVRGRLLDAAGKPVRLAFMLSRIDVENYEHVVRMPVEVRDGRFELHGCDPVATYRVIFLDASGRQGAHAEISGKQAGGEPVTVCLAPCGTGKAHLVGKDGRPFRDKGVKVDVVVTPGPSGGNPDKPMADEVWWAYFPGRLLQSIPRTDDRGWLTLAGLVPGATYRLHTQQGWKDFTVESGKTTDLGDVTDPVLFADRN
jgi:RNA polymerase sigma factor (sigma-70 family)